MICCFFFASKPSLHKDYTDRLSTLCIATPKPTSPRVRLASTADSQTMIVNAAHLGGSDYALRGTDVLDRPLRARVQFSAPYARYKVHNMIHLGCNLLLQYIFQTEYHHNCSCFTAFRRCNSSATNQQGAICISHQARVLVGETVYSSTHRGLKAHWIYGVAIRVGGGV